MIWIEIQEGKERMKIKEFQNLGSTAACTLRGVMATKDFDPYPLPNINVEGEEDENESPLPHSNPQDARRVWCGDSWFGSVKTAANIGKGGHHAIMQVKTAHARYPKKFLETKMKDYPGGTWITLEGHAENEDVDVVAIGYKYNKKTVLQFVITRGAGTTEPGNPYEARFPDKFGNVCTRHVLRPHVIAMYFKYSNCVDVHNQARQFDLALEKKWLTMNPYFRLYTTMLGMIVTNVWKTLKKIGGKKLRKSAIVQFADELAYDIIEDANQEEEDDYDSVFGEGSSDNASTISTLSPMNSIQGRMHTKVKLPGGRQLRCIWCSRVNLIERKCTLQCLECNKGFCRDDQGNSCWSLHVAHGGVPASPKRGTRKRKSGEE